MGYATDTKVAWTQEAENPQETAPFLPDSKSKPKTWRTGVLACAIASTVVLLANVAFMALVAQRQSIGSPDETPGRLTWALGDRRSMYRINSVIHLIINVLSTIVVGASSYCMQCLSAPTREELDKAHRKKEWLDIGILSLRNLKIIRKRRVLLWWMLGITSFPIHLFYNSAVISAIAYRRYWPILVTRPFIEQSQISGFESYDSSHMRNLSSDIYNEFYQLNESYRPYEAMRLRDLHLKGRLERLDTLDCIHVYARPFQDRGSVLVVMENTTTAAIDERAFSEGGLWYAFDGGASWMCTGENVDVSCELSQEMNGYKANISTWRPGKSSSPIAYCLSESDIEPAKVQSNLQIMIIVVVLTALKTAIMYYVAFAIKEDPILTVGDAVVSYLKEPDVCTQEMCLVTKEDIRKQTSQPGEWSKTPVAYIGRRKRLFASADRKRWGFSVLFYLLVFGAACGVFGYKFNSLAGDYPVSFSAIFRLGIGTPSEATLLDLPIQTSGTTGLISNTIIANLAQAVLTLVYFTYNNLFTAMSLAYEWSSYAFKRKGLRLSSPPQGHQRSTYFLQVPYRLAIPLTFMSGLIHWLASQSIFIAVIDAYQYSPKTGYWSKTPTTTSNAGRIETDGVYCSCSLFALFLFGIIWLIMIMILFGAASRKTVSAMPLVGSCSAAISAACHVPSSESGLATAIAEVQWGVTDEPQVPDVPGHCAFSKEAVRHPLPGEVFL